MRLYLIRHADPIYPTDTITEHGEREAAALAERLAGEGLTRLYVSPLGRAQATARPVAAATGLEPVTLDWTAEWGRLQVETRHGRRALWDIDGEVLHAEGLPALPALATTREELTLASDAFFAELGYQRDGARYRIVAPNRERIAVVCHGGFGLGWLAHLLRLPLDLVWAGLWLPPTSVSILLWDERSERHAVPRALCVGDTGHLHAAGIPVLPRGVKANYD